MDVGHPFRIDGRGRTATAPDADAHVRDLIEQLLFTAPGERVNRPTFGTPLMQILFAPASDELAAATRFQVQGALQQWLGDLVHVEAVDVRSDGAAVVVTVRYVVRRTQQRAAAQFRREP